ncbi:unnamed protein product [Symbiodinium natans]|uniref:Uncharacterized protein n=1 Tax=Symbiodinium natans TaxID=878477 RepID=A0A812LYG8_9DINO|nr:unnamed protein product [Symbiodinium natans]
MQPEIRQWRAPVASLMLRIRRFLDVLNLTDTLRILVGLWIAYAFGRATLRRALGYAGDKPGYSGYGRRRRRPTNPPVDAPGEDLFTDLAATRCLEITSRLSGSIAKLFRQAGDGEGWSGFCAVCKRPLDVKIVTQSHSLRTNEVNPQRRGRYAFVICLWGSSKDYVLGALVLGYSIKRTKTQNALVCLHADDVPAEYVQLLQLFWECRVVEHIEVKAARRLSTDDKIEESRFFKVFTKLRALEQTDFEKVLVMDIDLLVLSNIDDLFELPAPAGMKRGMNKGRWPYTHGDDIDGTTFFGGRNPGNPHSWGQGTGINAGVMLLEPNAAEFQVMQEELLEPYHPAHVRGNGPEQDYLSRFWADRPWRHISVEYNYQIHHLYNALHPMLGDVERLKVAQNLKSIRVIHYSGDSEVKPWTRCLEKTFGWPSRKEDDEYMKEFLSAYHSYLLWVEKDRERWTRMERTMFEDSGIKGFSLGEDGVIYYQEEEGSEKMPLETAPEAVETALAATRFFLSSWFDTLEAANGFLGYDLCERLSEASTTVVAPQRGAPEDPWEDDDPWSQGVRLAARDPPELASTRSLPEKGESPKNGKPPAVHEAWAQYVPDVPRRPPSRPQNHKQEYPSWEQEVTVVSSSLAQTNFAYFRRDARSHVREIQNEFLPEVAGQELSGLFVRDNSRVREFSPKDKDDLDGFKTFVANVERDEMVLLAALNLPPPVMSEVLACLEPLGISRWKATLDTTGMTALAVIGIAGRQTWQVNVDAEYATTYVRVERPSQQRARAQGPGLPPSARPRPQAAGFQEHRDRWQRKAPQPATSCEDSTLPPRSEPPQPSNLEEERPPEHEPE